MKGQRGGTWLGSGSRRARKEKQNVSGRLEARKKQQDRRRETSEQQRCESEFSEYEIKLDEEKKSERKKKGSTDTKEEAEEEDLDHRP